MDPVVLLSQIGACPEQVGEKGFQRECLCLPFKCYLLPFVWIITNILYSSLSSLYLFIFFMLKTFHLLHVVTIQPLVIDLLHVFVLSTTCLCLLHQGLQQYLDFCRFEFRRFSIITMFPNFVAFFTLSLHFVTTAHHLVSFIVQSLNRSCSACTVFEIVCIESLIFVIKHINTTYFCD
jgi:hypothetical protein